MLRVIITLRRYSSRWCPPITASVVSFSHAYQAPRPSGDLIMVGPTPIPPRPMGEMPVLTMGDPSRGAELMISGCGASCLTMVGPPRAHWELTNGEPIARGEIPETIPALATARQAARTTNLYMAMALEC